MSKLKFTKFIPIIILILLINIIFLYYFYNKKNGLKISFPYSADVSNNDSFVCDSVLYSGIFANSNQYLIGGIEGTITKGTDKVSMKIINQKTLEFMTVASIKIGMTKGDEFLIINNDSEKLQAVWFNDLAISSIILNKKNGLAVWLKGSQNPLYDAPNGQVIYLTCK